MDGLGLFERVAITLSVVPQSANNTTLNGTSIDLSGWDFAAFVLAVGATDTTVAMKVQDSADDTTFADVTGAQITTFTATDDNKAAAIELRPSRRFVRPVVTIGAGTSGAVVSVTAYRWRRTGDTPITLPIKELVKVA